MTRLPRTPSRPRATDWFPPPCRRRALTASCTSPLAHSTTVPRQYRLRSCPVRSPSREVPLTAFDAFSLILHTVASSVRQRASELDAGHSASHVSRPRVSYSLFSLDIQCCSQHLRLRFVQCTACVGAQAHRLLMHVVLRRTFSQDSIDWCSFHKSPWMSVTGANVFYSLTSHSARR